MPALVGLTEQTRRAPSIGDAGLIVGEPRLQRRRRRRRRTRSSARTPTATSSSTRAPRSTSRLPRQAPSQVPSVIGQTKQQAAAGSGRQAATPSSSRGVRRADRARSCETDPGAGQQRAARAPPVTVFDLDGPEKVPDVVGLTAGRRRAAARATPGSVPTCRDVDIRPSRKGTVIHQMPARRARRQPQGSTVTIVVSSELRAAALAAHDADRPTTSDRPSAARRPAPSADPPRHVARRAGSARRSARGQRLGVADRSSSPSYAGAVMLVLELLGPSRRRSSGSSACSR